MKRRTWLTGALAFVTGLSFLNGAHAQVLNLNDAINKAGRQRMLSQRLAKAYFQIGLEVDLERSKKILDQSLATFDRQLVELKVYAPTPQIKSALVEMEATWLEYKLLLVGKAANRIDGKSVMSLSESLLSMAEKLTALLETHAGGSAGKIINISGRQRMLSQRMGKYYQAIQWQIAPKEAEKILESSRLEFNAAMNLLDAAPNNTPAIKTELAQAKVQWAFFDHAIRQAPDPRFLHKLSTDVANTSERILDEMDTVTNLYQKLSALR